jgi:hypothetical protein
MANRCKSLLIHGVGNDTEYLAEHIVRRAAIG